MVLINRRQFSWLSAGCVLGLAPLPALAQIGPTANEVISRIRARLGGDWGTDTSDGLKAGDLSTPVTGIVTTALASLQVLHDAVKAGANMVITNEPVFFSKADTPAPPVRRMPGGAALASGEPQLADPVFTAKNTFIKDNHLVICRLDEHWHTQQADQLLAGFATVMGWNKYVDKGDARRFVPPRMSLQTLAHTVRAKLGNRGGMRVVGNRDLPVRSIGFLPGSTPLQASLDLLPRVDVIIAGEVREWETVEYVRDTVALGSHKALICVGRTVSEEPGMRQCAAWIGSLVPEVPVAFLSAGDPYWRPQV